MSLTTRLTLLFLAALAMVLAGFSTTLYALAHQYLHGQARERLHGALATLTAAAEINAQGVEWEPHERRFSIGENASGDQIRWIVRNHLGQRVDGTQSSASEELFGHGGALADQHDTFVTFESQSWRLAQQRLRSDLPPAPPDGPGVWYPELVLTTAISLRPVQTALRNLALALGGTSLGIWLLAAVATRRVCRRGLAPLTHLADAVRATAPSDLGQRLPVAATADELEALGQAFNDLLGRLHESFERQRRFTGDASHQLRTPLTAMLGQVEVALLRTRAPEEYQRVLTLVQRRVLSLRQMVDMLLFLARADAEARLPDLEPIELGAWLHGHLKSWSEHPRHRDLCLQPLPEDSLCVKAQAPLLGQLVDNLLDNACKYSAPGSSITLGLSAENGQVCLVVADRGQGIASEDLPRVFDPFYRSTRAAPRHQDGVGLGLAIVQRIATVFGGGVAVESTLGQGSRFILRLPRVSAPAECRSDLAHGLLAN